MLTCFRGSFARGHIVWKLSSKLHFWVSLHWNLCASVADTKTLSKTECFCDSNATRQAKNFSSAPTTRSGLEEYLCMFYVIRKVRVLCCRYIPITDAIITVHIASTLANRDTFTHLHTSTGNVRMCDLPHHPINWDKTDPCQKLFTSIRVGLKSSSKIVCPTQL